MDRPRVDAIKINQIYCFKTYELQYRNCSVLEPLYLVRTPELQQRVYTLEFRQNLSAVSRSRELKTIITTNLGVTSTMTSKLNKNTLLSAAIAAATAGAAGLFTQGCTPACDPDTDPTCPARPVPVNVQLSLDGNKIDEPYVGQQQVVISTPQAEDDERDLYFAFGGDLPDTNCDKVYDGSAIEIRDDIQFRVAAVTESEKWKDYKGRTVNYFIDQPSYPNAALKDAWLAAETKAVESHLLCASGLDADGPDANGKCDYPETPAPGTDAFWSLVLDPKNWTATCENAASGSVSLDYAAVWNYQDNVIQSVDIDITYNNCTLNGITYDGTTQMDMKTDTLLNFDVVSNITVSGPVTGSFREETVRVYNANLSEEKDKRFGDYFVACGIAGCEAGNTEVQWNCPSVGNKGVRTSCDGNFWLVEPRMQNGCATENVEDDPDPAVAG